jgi:hypothetical protein
MYKLFFKDTFVKEVNTIEEIEESKKEIYQNERKKIADKLDLLEEIKNYLKNCYGRRESDTAESYKKLIQTMHPEVIDSLEKLISLEKMPITSYWIHYPKMGELGFYIKNEISLFGDDVISLADYELELFMTLPNDKSFKVEET